MPENITAKTLNDLLEEIVTQYIDLPALGWALQEPLTYGELFDNVLKVSEQLIEAGIKKGDRVAILGENSPNWVVSYFSVIRVGAVAVPILPDFPESDIRHILLDSEARVLFTTQKQLLKLGDLGQCRLKYIITLDDFSSEQYDVSVEPFSSIVEKALDFIKKIPESIGLKSGDIKGGDLASIIYTSGTSGRSKAVMLTHSNFLANLNSIVKLIEMSPRDKFLSMLPLSHTYEFTIGFLLPLASGARIAYLDRPPTPGNLEKICKVEKPTSLCMVPLILEKIYKKKVQPVLEKSRAVKVACLVPGVRQKVYHKIAGKLMDFLGGNIKIMAIGGAPFNREAEKFFRASGIPYLIGYGLTETAPLLAGGPFGDRTIKVGSTGKPIYGVEIKIENKTGKNGIGEIFARGDNVMKGYYRNPELTAEVIDKDGWFHTGDLGYIDRSGNLVITGRSKNMILMSNGENIYPEVIEDILNSMLHVAESLVLENNGLLEAWIYLDYDLIDQETKGKADSDKAAYIAKLLAKTKNDVNAQVSSFSKISRIVNLDEPFIKTATRKIKRHLYVHSD